MDTYITTWEMNMESPITILREEIATGPMEPYILDREGINWN